MNKEKFKGPLNVAKFGIFLIVIGVIFLYRTEIVTFYVNTFLRDTESAKIEESDRNEYYTGKDYYFVQHTDDFEPDNQQDLLNIYYTVIDSGLDYFEFYCSTKYEACISDVEYISNNQLMLSNINNFVHPFNSFDSIETEYDTIGKVSIRVNHLYNADQITAINLKVDKIMEDVINKASNRDAKLKLLHDYIVNNTEYDSEKADNKKTEYLSNIAYGALIQGYAICGGYSDSVAIILHRMGIPNIKISSENHVWNLLNIDNKWIHLDTTWDDPINKSGVKTIEYTYYLVDTKTITAMKNDNQHEFDKEVYKEADY